MRPSASTESQDRDIQVSFVRHDSTCKNVGNFELRQKRVERFFHLVASFFKFDV